MANDADAQTIPHNQLDRETIVFVGLQGVIHRISPLSE